MGGEGGVWQPCIIYTYIDTYIYIYIYIHIYMLAGCDHIYIYI